MKVIVFDLDNTLCDLGKEIALENVNLLKKLEQKGHKIVICSGKPTYYLCGLMRQVGLNEPILVGENGATISFGVNLPPEKNYVVSNQDKAISLLSKIKDLLKINFNDKIWFQPNEICLTAFPKKKEYFGEIRSFLNKQELTDCIIYEHVDSFDIVPKDVNKFEGLKYLSNLLSISSEDFIAVGDSVNDYPMFDFCKLSIGVNLKEKEKASLNFENINEALLYLLKI